MSIWQSTSKAPFIPENGKCYEIKFDPTDIKKIQVRAPDAIMAVHSSYWFDLELEDFILQDLPKVVTHYRDLDCPTQAST